MLYKRKEYLQVNIDLNNSDRITVEQQEIQPDHFTWAKPSKQTEEELWINIGLNNSYGVTGEPQEI